MDANKKLRHGHALSTLDTKMFDANLPTPKS